MMKKLIALVLVLAFAAPALADDLIPASFRGEPGSTYSHWTYDDPCGVYDYDLPEESWFVSHPLKVDPETDPCSGAFSGQYWGSNDDPCAPVWYDEILGRTGVIDFAFGSWDINNFVHDQPAKDIWMQITYFNGSETPTEFAFGGGYTVLEYVEGDPCGGPMGSYEGPMSTWNGLPEPFETWEEEGVVLGYTEGPLDTWPTDPCLAPMKTWDSSVGGEEEVEYFVDGERVSEQVLGDGWLHDVWAITLPLNPDFEWIEGGWAENVLIDQVVIETLCYVPEPATMVLLGLGSLLMIRRKR